MANEFLKYERVEKKERKINGQTKAEFVSTTTTTTAGDTVKTIVKPTHNGWVSEKAFIDYLENTLIPDLRESGHNATADDFEDAAWFIKTKGGK